MLVTQVLNPNQDMRSRILSFKEETVKEILSVVPRLASNQALQLLQRGDVARFSSIPFCFCIFGIVPAHLEPKTIVCQVLIWQTSMFRRSLVYP